MFEYFKCVMKRVIRLKRARTPRTFHRVSRNACCEELEWEEVLDREDQYEEDVSREE